MNITVFGRHKVQYCKMKYKVCSSAVLVTLVDAQHGWYQNKKIQKYIIQAWWWIFIHFPDDMALLIT